MRYPHPTRLRSSDWSSNRICRRVERWKTSALPDRPFTAGMIAINAADRKPWRIAPHGRIGSGTVSQRRSAARSSTWRWISRSFPRGNWRCGSRTRQEYFVSEASVYRLLKSHDLIPSPAYIVIKAAEEFKDKTTAPNQLWQTDFTYLKITGWGWYYLSTVLDDFSRFIVAWKLCATMKAQDVTDTLDLALANSGLDHVTVVHRPRLLSDNGSSYIAADLANGWTQEDRTYSRRALPPSDPGQNRALASDAEEQGPA